MMLVDKYFKIAWKNLKRRKLRSWLTFLGIFISISIIFVLISLSVGLQIAVEQQFEQLGTDKFYIIPGTQINPPGTEISVKLTEKDIEAIKKVSGIKKVAGWAIGNAKVEFKNEIKYRYIFGINPEDLDMLLETGVIEIAQGSSFSKEDSGKVVLGYDYGAKRMFTREVSIGDKIEINGKEFKVRGIMKRVGNPDDDKNTFIPLDDFKVLFNSGDKVDYIVVQVKEGEDTNEIASRVEKELRDFRNVDEKTQDFTVLTPEELLGTFRTILNIVMAFLVGVAAISLIVGGIGIATTMYTSILERYKEIGVMKAVGARNSDILMVFVVEAGLLGMIGGIIGVLLGFGASKTIEILAINYYGTNLLKAAAPLYLIVGCIAFAFLVGVISGIFPARQASKIKPVEALRYE